MTRPSYWTSARNDDDGSERVESRYMRRKLEYLLRHCATHPDGCQGEAGLSEARVVKVERIENDALWRRYESRREAVRPRRQAWAAGVERSRPIRCELRGDERMLFHGTSADSIEGIAEAGLDLSEAARSGRYGVGAYFTDESCKAHGYSGHEDQHDGSRIFCMLYCRVATGKTLRMRATGVTASRNYLTGMRMPSPNDPVFASRMRGRRRVREAWDSVDVTGASRSTERQVHREVVVFDSRQIYPEYVVYYRLDTEEEEEELRLAYEAEQAEAEQAEADTMLAAALSLASSGSPMGSMAAMLAASSFGLTGMARRRRQRYAASFMMLAAVDAGAQSAESALQLLEFGDEEDDDDSDEDEW